MSDFKEHEEIDKLYMALTDLFIAIPLIRMELAQQSSLKKGTIGALHVGGALERVEEAMHHLADVLGQEARP